MSDLNEAGQTVQQLSFDDLEEWRPVVGYEGFYEVSDLGRVRSLRAWRGVRGRILRANPPREGLYRTVELCVNGVTRTKAVHRLVAESFIGPRPPGLEVRHLDGDKLNCALSNLAYGTQSENQLDRVRHGGHNLANLTHCIAGHEFTPENTYTVRRKDGRFRQRGCRTCRRKQNRESMRRSRARAREAA